MKKKYIILSILLSLISIAYTLVIMKVDVRAIGPNESTVGLASINGWFKDLIGSNMDVYKITEYFGYAIFLIVGVYGLIGLCQLIKRKSLFKVDRELICLGELYVLMLAVYVIFDKVAINYRPILIDGVLEPSYPSSHTILAICIAISSLIISKKYFRTFWLYLITFVTMFLLTVILVGRVMSGVHWLTDIGGGIIISATLLMYFYTVLKTKKSKKA